jgi:hypothetical protein
MRLLAVTCGLLLCAAGAAWCGENAAASAGSGDRLLFPKNFLRGYVDFQFAPPHNEPDLGLCAVRLGPPAAGVPECAGYARYIWSGYIEFQPFGRTIARRLFLFAEPKLFAGDNIPQVRYTASMSGILWEETLGAGITLPRNFEFRLTHHRTKLLGRYGATPSAVTGHPDGPYGLYTTLGARWYFGGYGGR